MKMELLFSKGVLKKARNAKVNFYFQMEAHTWGDVQVIFHMDKVVINGVMEENTMGVIVMDDMRGRGSWNMQMGCITKGIL